MNQWLTQPIFFMYLRDFKVGHMEFLEPQTCIMRRNLTLRGIHTLMNSISVRSLCIRWYTLLSLYLVQFQILHHIFGCGLWGRVIFKYIVQRIFHFQICSFCNYYPCFIAVWPTQNYQLFFMKKFSSLPGGTFLLWSLLCMLVLVNLAYHPADFYMAFEAHQHNFIFFPISYTWCVNYQAAPEFSVMPSWLFITQVFWFIANLLSP